MRKIMPGSSLKARHDPMATTCGAEQEGTAGLFNLLGQIKKLSCAIPADTGTQLIAADHQAFPWGKLNIPKDFKHILFSGFSGEGTDIAGLGTIVRAEKIRMAYKYIAVFHAQRMRQEGIHSSGNGDPLQGFSPLIQQAPLRRQVDGDRRNDPVGVLFFPLRQMFCKVGCPIGFDKGSSGTPGLMKFFFFQIHQHKTQIFDFTG